MTGVDTSDGPVICDAVPAIVPMGCRRAIRVVQGQAPPPCGGFITVKKFFKVEEFVNCPQCGLLHGFVSTPNGIMYGAVL